MTCFEHRWNWNETERWQCQRCGETAESRNALIEPCIKCGAEVSADEVYCQRCVQGWYDDVVISVANCRCQVGRWLSQGRVLSFQPASNWRALEADAQQAVEQAGGAITLSGIYECPAELAEQAVWLTS